MLAAKYGGYLTFGALGGGKESAPGQPTLHQLRQIYRLPQLTPACQVIPSSLLPRVLVFTNFLCKSKKHKERSVYAIGHHNREPMVPRSSQRCVSSRWLLASHVRQLSMSVREHFDTNWLQLTALLLSFADAAVRLSECRHCCTDNWFCQSAPECTDSQNLGQQSNAGACTLFICFRGAGVWRHRQSSGTQPQPTAAQCSHGGSRA